MRLRLHNGQRAILVGCAMIALGAWLHLASIRHPEPSPVAAVSSSWRSGVDDRYANFLISSTWLVVVQLESPKSQRQLGLRPIEALRLGLAIRSDAFRQDVVNQLNSNRRASAQATIDDAYGRPVAFDVVYTRTKVSIARGERRVAIDLPKATADLLPP